MYVLVKSAIATLMITLRKDVSMGLLHCALPHRNAQVFPILTFPGHLTTIMCVYIHTYIHYHFLSDPRFLDLYIIYVYVYLFKIHTGIS